MKKKFFSYLFILFLASCSSSQGIFDSFSVLDNYESFDSSNNIINVKTTKIESLLPNAFSNDGFDKEIRCDSFLIIGNGFYKQETNIMTTNTPSFYNYLKSIEVNETPEDYHTRYGGGLTIYSFDNQVIKFWDGFLFIESNGEYKGDFYKVQNQSVTVGFESNINYYSFKIDNGILDIKDDSASYSSDEIRNALSEMKYMLANENKSFSKSDTKKIIRLNEIDSLYIYNEKDFSIFQSDIIYSLNDNYSFSFVL